mmetsp:Transcript_40604/g.112777  ORF Transcript_40604/g.112777 Transcript_40604/m.112777 type:complete len:237 (-) Transcript_40604:53-763(-)
MPNGGRRAQHAVVGRGAPRKRLARATTTAFPAGEDAGCLTSLLLRRRSAMRPVIRRLYAHVGGERPVQEADSHQAGALHARHVLAERLEEELPPRRPGSAARDEPGVPELVPWNAPEVDGEGGPLRGARAVHASGARAAPFQELRLLDFVRPPKAAAARGHCTVARLLAGARCRGRGRAVLRGAKAREAGGVGGKAWGVRGVRRVVAGCVPGVCDLASGVLLHVDRTKRGKERPGV